MSVRHLGLILVTVVVSVWCYVKADQQIFASTLAQTIRNVRLYYVEPVDTRELFENAMRGMIDGSLDEYSRYIPPMTYQQVEQDLDQEFGGVGIEVGKKSKSEPLLVLSPLVGSPAYRGGLRAGDKILAIDGQPTDEITQEDSIKLMRGRPGTPVQLSVLHSTASEPFEVTIIREVITVQSVLGDMRQPDGDWDFQLAADPRIGYLRITTFGKHTVDELRAVLERVEELGFEALLLDLRNNAGGLLDAAVDTCDLFIDEGLIVSTRGRDPIFARDYRATAELAVRPSLPLVVLVNSYSASASEIVAACLQDHRRAVIVGQRTWGKGTVQNILPLEGGHSALRLTTATYWRPSGRNIHRLSDASDQDAWGVDPDPEMRVVVEDQELERLIDERRRRDLVDEVRAEAVRLQRADNADTEDTDREDQDAEDQDAEDSEPQRDRQLDLAVEHLRSQLTPRMTPRTGS